MSLRRTSVFLLAALASAGCSDELPVPGPGTMTVTLTGPNPTEGAAVLSVTGPGIQSVSSIDSDVYGEARGETVRVVVIAEPAGELRFTMAVEDTLADFTGVVHQVVGPFDLLRTGLSAYNVDIRR